MRVLLDTTPARLAPRSGTGVYVYRLLDALRELDGLEVLETHNPRRRPPAGGGIGSARNLASELWWDERELPRLAHRGRVDLVHHPRPPLRLPAGVRNVVTVQDLAFERLPECFDPRWRRIAHHTHRIAARRAAAVIAISHTTAGDVRQLWGIEATVAPLGPGQANGTAPAADPRHFLYVGDAEPRKNLPTLLSAYAAYRAEATAPLPLVIAGSAATEAGGPGIVPRPGPRPHELRELLAGSAALLQPSRYEGFGLTALEAMASGVPVLAARSPGLVEVCDTAAEYAGVTDTAAWTAALHRLAGDRGLRERLREAGRRRARAFSWAASAQAHLAAYSLALRSSP